MRSRCRSPNAQYYDRYGGRGIGVCPEWDDYETFYHWAIASGWEQGLHLDRENNDGNYGPTNCRWVTVVTNNRNRSCVNRYEYQGELYTVGELHEKFAPDLAYQAFKMRLLRGWSVDKAINWRK